MNNKHNLLLLEEMVGCWSPGDVKEEIPLLYDDFDPLKEWLVDPERAQFQIPSDFNNSCLEPRGLCFNGVEIEQTNKILESSIDVKMEKVSLVENSVKLKENEGGNDGEMKLEALKSDPPNIAAISEGESSEEGGSPSVAAESDSGDSSSDEFSCDESLGVADSLLSSEDEVDVGTKRRDDDEEFEEGEVREFGAHGIDFPRVEGKCSKGPIWSKHEVEDLTPVPKVEVSLQSHHQSLPVGVISSIMSNKVIVEGSVRHNPLDEGSILWVTDTQLPLGLVDEIFGPVKNPYYVVRYNTEEEVPSGVRVGMEVSFVAEFASQILNDKELYKKGYDASGDNDDEVDIEAEFSDDEKEAEYRRSMRQGKRVIDDMKGMKQEARVERRTTLMGPRAQHKVKRTGAPLSMNQPHPTALAPPQLSPLLKQSGSWNPSSGATNTNSVAPPTMPQFPHAMQGVNFLGNPSQQLLSQHQDAAWSPGFLPQLQNIGLQGDLSTQLQNQNIILNNFFNLLTYQQQLQQFLPHQGSTLPWVGAAPSLQPLGQNNFAPSLFSNGFINEQIQGHVPLLGTSGLGNGQIQGQAPFPGTSGLGNVQIQGQGPFQGTSGLGNGKIQGQGPFQGTSGLGNGQIQGQAPLPGTSGLGNGQIQGEAPLSLAPSMQFNAGSSSSLHFNGRNPRSHGRTPYHRGGGRFFSGRGGRQPNR